MLPRPRPILISLVFVLCGGLCGYCALGRGSFASARSGTAASAARRPANLSPQPASSSQESGDSAPIFLRDENDRAAFRQWFTVLADTAYYHPPAEVTDCAALVRWAAREALRAHTPEWRRRESSADDVAAWLPAFADVRRAPAPADGVWPIFRTGVSGRAEFADARTLLRWNTVPITRDVRALRPGDLLFFAQSGQQLPYHVIVFVGPSVYEGSGDDWIVYHTGPISRQSAVRSRQPWNRAPGDPAADSHVRPVPVTGEMRKSRLLTLREHPDKRWRPEAWNPQFLGIFRLTYAP